MRVIFSITLERFLGETNYIRGFISKEFKQMAIQITSFQSSYLLTCSTKRLRKYN